MNYYMICSEARSGTHFLKAPLGHLKIGNPREFFCGDILSSITNINSLMEYCVGGYWGVTVFSGYLASGIKKLKALSGLSTENDWEVLNTLFPGIKFIHYCRINKIKQAISAVKAGRTNVFVKRLNMPTLLDNTEFCRKEILQKIDKLVQREAAWLNFFDRYQITPYVLTYEDLCRDRVTALENLLCFLEFDTVNLTEALSGVQYPIQQYDEISEEWYQKYLKGEK